ncbi:UNVERIFIED_CONTAM: hypothetical protein PYX00_008723 [Menopon gallinae]
MEAKIDTPAIAKDAVFCESKSLPDGTPVIEGYDWNKGINYHELFKSYKTTGFQATNLASAIDEINKMLKCRYEQLPDDKIDDLETDEFIKRKKNCTIFLGFTSNLISSGLRESIRFLVQHSLVDCIVTTAGGVEEDFIKCLAPTYLGDFGLDGRSLRQNGLNRIGNLLVPNKNYCLFEDWLTPLLDEMVRQQNEDKIIWSPSQMIRFLGEKINNPESVYYWAAKNKIPVFSPAITDGSLGDMMFFHGFKSPGLVMDILSDLRRLNTMAIKAVNSGMIILGGGLIKHHICNANLMRNGADFSVFINTGSEYDGSDSGARPDEAISWGKIKKEADPVKVYADATIVFPMIIGETFARYHFKHS